jgi:CopA family copper-resistance protein
MTLAGRASGRRDQQMTAADRTMFAQMRMDPTDILDVNDTTYTYLINGHGPDENWTGLYRPGERVRLRIINASAMTIFNVRIPSLPMSVVSADGQNVHPVTVDEFQISVAETYDVVVRFPPTEDRAFTFIAEAMDRSGIGRATLAPRLGMAAAVPPLRQRPVLTMRDMGMGAMGHGSMPGMTDGAMPGMDHGAMPGMDQSAMPAAAAAHGAGAMAPMNMRDPANAPQVQLGPGVDMIAPMPQDRTGDPGLGLDDVGHKVLTYRDLMALTPSSDQRPPTRTLEIHLTGNMERFMWSFDGVRMSEGAEPIRFERNERVRVKLVNDSMMAHPIHLHGHFFEVVNGHAGAHPLKHTVNVLPGGFVRFDLTADAPGDWAFHCHLLYHMHAGMMRVVTIRPLEGDAA